MQTSLVPIFGGALALAIVFTLSALPQLTSVLFLAFAGIVLAVLLDAITKGVRRVLPGPRWAAFACTLLMIAVAVAVIGALIGPRIVHEVPLVAQRLPQAWQQLQAQLTDIAAMESVLGDAEQPFQWLAGHSQLWETMLSNTFGFLVNLFVIVFVGVYIAVDPGLYLRLSGHLMAAQRRREVRDLAARLGYQLRWWTIGRLGSMTIVALGTGFGLWALGVPLAFTLGLFAGLVSFVPYLGPILGLVPAFLLAASISLALAGWVVVLFAVVQIVESGLLTPLIQQRAVAMPPAALIVAQLIGGVLAGPLGILFAAPLLVTVAVVWRWGEPASHYDG